MLRLRKNEIVYYQNSEHVFIKTKDLMNALIRDRKTMELKKVPIADLQDRRKQDDDVRGLDLPLDAYSEERLKKANWRLSLIKPFLNESRGDKGALRKVAESNDLNISTLYNWIKKFDTYGHIGCLVDSDLKGGKGLGRLDKGIEEKITEAITDVYLDCKSVNETFRAVREWCTELGYNVPHINSIRRRIAKTSEYRKMAARVGPIAASEMYDPKIGTIPHAGAPLSIVQADHTLLDIMLVDEKNREPFRRPWITVLIDVYSRVILGFYISFEAPSAFSVGRAISHSILRKEKYLESLGLSDLTWPVWGKMTTLLCDNAKEFKGNMLKEQCRSYNITLKWRPPRKPRWGAHIERYLGTVAEELKNLPGATKVSKEMRSKFKPENTASLTLKEFEKWFTVWLTSVYHMRSHSGIVHKTPIQKWIEGINGDAESPGIGAPEVILDEEKLKLDLLPQFKRIIRSDGVHYMKFKFFAGVLRKWINARDTTSRGKFKPKRLFIFKIDPRDLSSILFLNPDDNKYHSVPSTLNIKPDILSMWNYRLAVAEVKKNKQAVNQGNIYAAHKRLNNIGDASRKLTKATQRKNERALELSREGPLTASAIQPHFKTEIQTIIKETEPYEELEYVYPRRSLK